MALAMDTMLRVVEGAEKVTPRKFNIAPLTKWWLEDYTLSYWEGNFPQTPHITEWSE